MVLWLEGYLRGLLDRYLDNERGQDVIVWILILGIIWLLLAGRRVIVQ